MLNIVLKDGSILPGVEVLVKKGNYTISKFSVRNAHTMNTGELRKAACCNLAESFETNPSIDASFTDAVTGTKQIQMLGLSGKYVQIMQDNIPMIRGFLLFMDLNMCQEVGLILFKFLKEQVL